MSIKEEELLDLEDKETTMDYIVVLEHDIARKYGHVRKLKKLVKELRARNRKLEEKCFFSQSGTMTSGQADSDMKAEITTFADENAGWSATVPADPDETFNLADNTDSDLGNFLSRPIEVATYQWGINETLFEELDVWSAYLSNDFIRDKIKNFDLLRMNLNMKVLISGTPFHYGRALAFYNPLNGHDDVTVVRGVGATFDADLIGASQKPHIFLNPTLNTGGVMKFPYFYKENYITLSKPDIAEKLGRVTFKSFGDLRHTDVGNPITISVYLWASEVTLTMPTSHDLAVLPSQAGKSKKKPNSKGKSKSMNSGDEYGQGIISKPASAVAKAAGQLAAIPLIAPYARATQIVATGVGDIARLFGFSRPVVITDTLLQKPCPVGNICNVDAADTVFKLTMDSKNEVTIDPRVTGLEACDEMGILDYVQRESYLTSFNWSSTDDPGQLLFNARVAPDLYRTVNYTTPSLRKEIHMTPACHMSQLFKYWQGSIKFRFQIVKSAYHKGRLLVRYDPREHKSQVDYNTNYSRVIDIADAEDFEITIGWGQAKAWLELEPIDTNIPNMGGIRLPEAVARLCNGFIELNVINELVSPSASSDISVNVYVSMCDDARFAMPEADKIANLSYFRVPNAAAGAPQVLESQSGIIAQDNIDEPLAATKLDTIASERPESDETMNVFFGENITSIRELVKRYTMTRYWADAKVTGLAAIYRYFNTKALPFYRGYDVNGLDSSDLPRNFNKVHNNPINWFLPVYAGFRGSMRHKYVFHSPGNMGLPVVTRQPYQENDIGIITTLTNGNINPVNLTTLSQTQDTFNGAATTGTAINNTVEVELPYYNADRFNYSRVITTPSLDCNTVKMVAVSSVDAANAVDGRDIMAFQQWVSAGEDFSMYFFTGIPIVYQYATPT